MRPKDIARRLPEEVWALLEPILPARIRRGDGRPPQSDRDCFHAPLHVSVAGIPWELLPGGFPSRKTVRRRSAVWLAPDAFHRARRHWPNGTECRAGPTGIGSRSTAPTSRPKKGRATRAVAGGPRQARDRQLARGGRAVPPGAVATPANANDGCRTEAPLAALVEPPPPARPPEELDVRRLPAARAAGACGNRPGRARAKAAGFRLRAPSRGPRRPGVGRIRQAVERRHDSFARFGRIGRRPDRSAKRFLGWIQLAACPIFLRPGFVRQS